ncbi:hypothetical protein [Marinobacter salexigens]|nr:hypothetical protein [Marinobacter salexigens]
MAEPSVHGRIHSVFLEPSRYLAKLPSLFSDMPEHYIPDFF